MITDIICPVCKSQLIKNGASLVCERRHCFDIASEGYVNLAIGKSSSGDSPEMCRARHDFLSKGYYRPLAEKIAEVLSENAPKSPSLVCDAGCGEGFYLREIKKLLPEYSYIGFDLAKTSVKIAAKSEKNEKRPISYAVAGIFDMPIKSDSCSAVLSVFAPVPHEEAARVLACNGIMAVVHPGKKHLAGLKEKLYASPYDNEEKPLFFDGFELVNEKHVSYSVSVKKEDMKNLLTMTPYYWKTSKEDAERFLLNDGFNTELEFIISVFRKI